LLVRYGDHPLSTSPSSPSTSEPRLASLDVLDELIAEVANLQKAVVEELLDRRARLCRELTDVDAELTELEGTPTPAPAKKTRSKAPASGPRKLTLPELAAELESAPGGVLNIRKANLDVKHTKALAKANPQQLQLGGKGSWPTVALRKTPGHPASSPPTAAAPQGMFAFGETSSEAQEKIG
jgi:hypothetical protein